MMLRSVLREEPVSIWAHVCKVNETISEGQIPNESVPAGEVHNNRAWKNGWLRQNWIWPTLLRLILLRAAATRPLCFAKISGLLRGWAFVWQRSERQKTYASENKNWSRGVIVLSTRQSLESARPPSLRLSEQDLHACILRST